MNHRDTENQSLTSHVPRSTPLPLLSSVFSLWTSVFGLWSTVFLISSLSFQLSAFLIPLPAFAQAPGYSREEVAARDAAGGQHEGIPARQNTGGVGQDLMMSGERSIGSARSSVRSRGSDSQSAMLRYDQHRDVEPPADALLRIGPWYSNLAISQSIGYRYMKLEGSGVDFLTSNDRGEILKDGSEFPMVTTLTMDNYVVLTRRMDLEANIKVSYEYFPMKTQVDRFEVDLTDEGVFGTFSSEFELTRDMRLLLYDDILYRTDYVDTRGNEDRYGGEEYERLVNTVGADWDWKPTPFDNVSLSASRSDEIPFDDEFDNQKRVHYTEVASYQRQLTPFAVGGVLANFSQSLYEVDTRPDIYLYGLGVFSAAQITRRLTGNASLGYQYSTYSGGDGSDTSGRGSLYARFGLGHQISEEKSQKIGYQRTLSESFAGGLDIQDSVDYSLSWEGGLFPGSISTRYSIFSPQDSGRSGYSDWSTALLLRNQLTRLILLTFRTSYSIRSNDAVAEIDPDAPDVSSDYETFTVRLGTSMRVTEKTSLNVYAEHADRTSENPDLAYTRDVIAAILTWSHKF